MTNQPKNSLKFVFFGTAPLASAVLNELEKAGYIPALIVAARDKELRNGKTESPPEKKWAQEHNVEVVQPEKIDDDFLHFLEARSSRLEADLFIVASYGKILPEAVLDIPTKGVVNVHPSLLPRLRGASPIRSAILNDEKETGVSIMLMDEKMDHGPLLAQKKVEMPNWPPRGRELDELLAREGGKLLAEILPAFLTGEIASREQDHASATYCSMFKKEDGQLDLSEDAYKNLLKIRACEGWPGAFTYFERSGKKIRVGILEAHLHNKELVIDTVQPEGKKPMTYEEFLRSGATPAN